MEMRQWKDGVNYGFTIFFWLRPSVQWQQSLPPRPRLPWSGHLDTRGKRCWNGDQSEIADEMKMILPIYRDDTRVNFQLIVSCAFKLLIMNAILHKKVRKYLWISWMINDNDPWLILCRLSHLSSLQNWSTWAHLASSGSSSQITHDFKTHPEIFMISCKFSSFLAAPLIKGQFASAPKFQRWA